MSSSEPDHPDDSEGFVNSAEDQLLRALAAAPRPDAQGLAARALPELAATLRSADDAGGSVPQPGDVIDGRYRIEGVLGSGGMGVVFAATQLSTHRQVALKWMRVRGRYRTDSDHDAAFLRFVREAQVAGRIRHPNVVDVYDAGVDPGAPYLVMEKLEGETLRARMDRGPMAWDEALGLILPAMDGVIAAHAKGVIHRDLKPDNLFIARGAQGVDTPKVLDFGISRLHDTDASGEPSLTRTGMMIGTPAYMPLEQLRGAGNSDARTDVYALGVMLYEMLAGRRPYVARNAADYAALITSQPATRLSEHRPDLADAREAAVMKALGREPDERFASVEAFVQALTLLPPVQTRSPRRTLAVVVLLLALGVLAFLSWPGDDAAERVQPEPSLSRAVQPTPVAPATARDERAAPEQVPPVSAAAAPEDARRPQAVHPKRTGPSGPAPAAAVSADRGARVPALRPQDFKGSASAVADPPAPPPAGPRLPELGREQF